MEKGLRKTFILTGKAGGIESYQLLLSGEAPIEEYISAEYRGTIEYRNFLTETSTKFATKLLDHNEQSSPGIANGLRIAKSSKGWKIIRIREINYKDFELTLKGKLTELSRERSKLELTAEQTSPATLGGALN